MSRPRLQESLQERRLWLIDLTRYDRSLSSPMLNTRDSGDCLLSGQTSSTPLSQRILASNLRACSSHCMTSLILWVFSGDLL